VFNQVENRLNEYPLIKMSRSNKMAISQFKQSGNGVLFASGSMWEGIDCPGEILSSVIIVRLPFPARSQMMEFKKEQYSNVINFVDSYATPQMLIKLKQGAGRLIRTETDTGVVSILDARASRNGVYHDRVRKAFKQYPLIHTVQEVKDFMSGKDGFMEGGKMVA
jgi:ATP-dependent DNA helicase DinG